MTRSRMALIIGPALAVCLVAGPSPQTWAGEGAVLDGPVMAPQPDPRPVSDMELRAFLDVVAAIQRGRERVRERYGDAPIEDVSARFAAAERAAAAGVPGIDWARYLEILNAVWSQQYPGLAERVRAHVRARKGEN